MRDLYHNLKATQLLAAVAAGADVDSASVDMQGYDSLLLVANVGVEAVTISETDFIELGVEESDNDSDFTDVADADLHYYVASVTSPAMTGVFASAVSPPDIPAVFITGYKGNKRYVRVRVEFSGTHSPDNTPISITAIQGNAMVKPVN